MGVFFQDEENVNNNSNDFSQQNPYGGTVENPYGSSTQNEKEGSGFGIAALVLGIVSLVFFCSCFTYVTAPLAIIFGIVQLVRNKKVGRGMAIAGLITGIISLAACIMFWAIAVGNTAVQDSIREQYEGYDFEDPKSIEKFIEDYENSMTQDLEDELDLDEDDYQPL